MLEVPFISFFIVLFAAVFFSALVSRLHLPWAVALITSGIIIGPHALGIFEPNDTILFLSQIGLVFLMFMAGLEVRLSSLKSEAREISIIALLTGSVPFIAGFALGMFFGFGTQAALLLGIILINSSVSVVVPALESRRIVGTRLGDAIIGSTLLQDIASLLLLSVFFQTSDRVTTLPLPLFYILLFAALVFMRWAIPRIDRLFTQTDIFGQELRTVLLVLVGTVIAFEALGLHPIIAGFFAGLVLSDTIRTQALKEKLRAIGYGIFIPIFFVVVGSQTDLTAFQSAHTALIVVVSIVAVSVVAKLIGGYSGARLTKFTPPESWLIAATSVPQLSTTLAVAFSSFSLGLITQELTTALIILSIVTTLLGPMLMHYAINRLPRLARASSEDEDGAVHDQKVIENTP